MIHPHLQFDMDYNHEDKLVIVFPIDSLYLSNSRALMEYDMRCRKFNSVAESFRTSEGEHMGTSVRENKIINVEALCNWVVSIGICDVVIHFGLLASRAHS